VDRCKIRIGVCEKTRAINKRMVSEKDKSSQMKGKDTSPTEEGKRLPKRKAGEHKKMGEDTSSLTFMGKA